MPVRFEAGFAVVPARVGGQAAEFVLDTGAADMLVTREAAARWELAADPGRHTRLLGTGGEATAPNAVLAGLQLGESAVAARNVPVQELPAVVHADGVLGAAVLRGFDVELDLAAGRVRLWEVKGCPAGREPLPVPFTTVALGTMEGETVIPVVVNGVRLTAVLDSGARSTVLRPEAAERVKAVAIGRAGAAMGVDGQRIAAAQMRVRSLAVGWDTAREVVVAVAPLEIGGADMLLGMDWLRQRRSWIGYAAGRFTVALPYAWR